MKSFIFYFFIIVGCFAYGQKSIDQLLMKHNKNTIPYLSIEELKKNQKEYILLDSRERKEFNVSHLENAIFVGYNNFTVDSLEHKIPNKSDKILVYCSLGLRSENTAEKLKKAGYNNVFNLYGGIFKWKNNNFPVYNNQKKQTDSIHAFSKTWSKWLKKGIKVL